MKMQFKYLKAFYLERILEKVEYSNKLVKLSTKMSS